MIKIAINGFGRIGRPTFKRILDNHPDLEVTAINDLTDPKTLAHLLKYDSNYGIYHRAVNSDANNLIVDEKKIKIFAEKEPTKLPWREIGVDIVLECTGQFSTAEGAQQHIAAGAKKVIISAPSESPEIPTYILGVNEEKYGHQQDQIISMASCTTNCLAPIAKILHEELIIEKALITTDHAYTTHQRLLDLPHKDLRRARAANLSIIPTSTGATDAVTKVLPELEGKINGLAIRVPLPVVSLCDIVAQIQKPTTVEKINALFKKAARQDKLKNILSVEEAPLVSIDYKGNSHSAIIDANFTMAQNDTLIKILAWYDNEWAYACRLAEMTEYIAKTLTQIKNSAD